MARKSLIHLFSKLLVNDKMDRNPEKEQYFSVLCLWPVAILAELVVLIIRLNETWGPH